jgi:hypothetical protein
MSLSAYQRQVLKTIDETGRETSGAMLVVIASLAKQGYVERVFKVTGVARAQLDSRLSDLVEEGVALLALRHWRETLHRLMLARGVDDLLKSTRWQLTKKGKEELNGQRSDH